MEQLQKLLSEVKHCVDIDKQIKEQKRQRGENFNVFNILGLSTNETRTHSAFIAELLNPEGSHGCGTDFLNSFIRHFATNTSFESNILKKADVRVEWFIGYKNEDETEGGRIDIAVFIGNYLIIIENKIYACDQKNQLVRYHNCADKLKEQGKINGYKIFYLTLDGSDASETSTDKRLKSCKDYFTISYSKDILAWLNDCKLIAVEKPLVRETIIQYINLIQELTYQDMNTELHNEMLAKMDDCPEAVVKIFEVGFYAYRSYVFHKYCTPVFEKEAENRGLLFDENSITDEDKYASFRFKKKEWGECVIQVESDGRYDKDFFIAIRDWGGKYSNVKLEKLDCFDEHPVTNCVYGWEYLSKYRNWDFNIVIDMINGEYCKYIMEQVDNILEELKRREIVL